MIKLEDALLPKGSFAGVGKFWAVNCAYRAELLDGTPISGSTHEAYELKTEPTAEILTLLKEDIIKELTERGFTKIEIFFSI